VLILDFGMELMDEAATSPTNGHKQREIKFRDGLLLTLGLMAIGTVSIACTPSYASIGLIAPLLVVAGRLVQGLSAGVELGEAVGR
jgi:MFS family permease